MLSVLTAASFCLLMIPSQSAAWCRDCGVILDHKANGNDSVDYAGTGNKICAYARDTDGEDVEICLWGSGDKVSDFEMPNELDDNFPLYIVTFGDDALWIDDMVVGWTPWSTRYYGVDNEKGWCLNTDAGDSTYFGEYVDGSCGAILKLHPDGRTFWSPKPSAYNFSGLNFDYPNASCEGSSQGVNLGNVNSYWQCSNKAKDYLDNGGDCTYFMYSPSYSYAWGCRCCKQTKIGNRGYHALWNIYKLP